MKKFLIKLKKKSFFMFILGILVCSGVVYGINVYESNSIEYIPTDESWKVSNVSEAINSLYSMKTELDNIKSLGNASATQILSGKTAVVGGELITGTISSLAAKTYTPSTSNQTISSGKYLSGTQTISGDADLISANIKSGVNIFGIAGNSNVVDTSSGDATAAQILKGKKAYVDGKLVTGTRTAQNNTYGVKYNNFLQHGAGATCSFSHSFTPTVSGKLVVFMTATRNQSGVSSAWTTRSVKVGGTEVTPNVNSADDWNGRAYWVTNVTANSDVSVSTLISGTGTSLTSCSLFVLYVQ